MKVLVFGSKGWIGQQFISNSIHTIAEAQSRAENYQDVPASYKDVPIRTMSQLSVESKTIAEERKDHPVC